MGDASLELLAEALEISAADRGHLAAKLIESLDSETDVNAEQAWAVEIQRRLQEMDEGRVQLAPWSEARRLIRGQDGSVSD